MIGAEFNPKVQFSTWYNIRGQVIIFSGPVCLWLSASQASLTSPPPVFNEGWGNGSYFVSLGAELGSAADVGAGATLVAAAGAGAGAAAGAGAVAAAGAGVGLLTGAARPALYSSSLIFFTSEF